ncbi:hypothetical protein [Pareuzebyella sediminis]|uniref:hypothetical protein n=1 Tax=Pareuzebyella sediminis TaxID=2607998 RepID=UPI0018E0D8A5|nr:hypothetical protein [Pareuzebyella sediminis]
MAIQLECNLPLLIQLTVGHIQLQLTFVATCHGTSSNIETVKTDVAVRAAAAEL